MIVRIYRNTIISQHIMLQGAVSAPLVVLSFWQLVVWAISADYAAGMHGSRADSLPPVAHFPAPLYVPMFFTYCKYVAGFTYYVILRFVARIKSLLPPNSASESFIIHHPDRIYSPDHGFSRGDGVALNPLAAGRSTGSATGRTSGFSSHLCRGFAPTQPAGGMAGPAAGQPFHRSGFYVSPWP